MENYGEEMNSSPNLPPLMEYSAHVTCFSDQSVDEKRQTNTIESFKSPLIPTSSSSKDSNFSPASFPFAKVSVQETLFSTHFEPNIGISQYPGSALMQDNSVLRFFLENNGIDLKRCSKAEFSPETDFSSAVSHQDDPITSEDGPVDLGCLWNY